MYELSVISVGGCLTNSNKNNKEDLLHDLASIVYSICARLYGQRRAKRKPESLVEQLEAKDGQE
jgi:putative resolvase